MQKKLLTVCVILFTAVLVWILLGQGAPRVSIGKHELPGVIHTLFIAVVGVLVLFAGRNLIRRNNIYKTQMRNLASMIQWSKQALVTADLDGNITSWNNGALCMYDYDAQEAVGKNISILFPEDKKYLVNDVIVAVTQKKSIENMEIEIRNNQGKRVVTSMSFSPIIGFGRDLVIGFSVIALDITTHRENEEKLKRSYEELSLVHQQLASTQQELSEQYMELERKDNIIIQNEERLRVMVEGANDGIWQIDFQSGKLALSDRWMELTGFNRSRFEEPWDALKLIVHPDDLQWVTNALQDNMNKGTSEFGLEYRIITADGELKWIFNRIKLILDAEGNRKIMSGAIMDITEEKKKDEQIKEMVYYDSLTRLPNRALFVERLVSSLEKDKVNNKRGAVLFLDLDNFKKINDTLGHDFGDEVLKVTAEVLKSTVHFKDTVARFAGDEFLVLLPSIDSYMEAVEICDNIISALSKPFSIKDKSIFISVSIGVAIYPYDGDNPIILLKNADAAMDAAKYAGKNRYHFFDKTIGESITRKSEIEKGIRRALENEEFMVYYQPKVNVITGKIDGMEALLRWKHEEMGWISPAEFIPVAEVTGLIIPVGEYVLKMVCSQVNAWKERNYGFDTVSVNVSAVQLKQEDFADMLKKVIENSGIEPSWLELEITETVLMQSIKDNVSVIEKIKGLGVKIAMDDFGTGYSSLNYLRKVPVNKVKIDKSFIDEIVTNEQDKSITSGIIQLAAKMNLEVVIEGVEYKEQVEILREMGGNVIQGFYFSRPVPAEEIEGILQKGYFQV